MPAGSDAEFRLRAELDRLMSRIASRGPHGHSRWIDGRVVLGHHLLREVPEAKHEVQPLKSRDGRYVIVFDGRIDNREEIFSTVDPNVRPPNDCPDVEIVLAAYLTWAEKSPRRLLGDFAFAVWDVREETLFAVRDPLAGRPLYFVDRADFLAFASHDEALIGLPGITAAPNEDHLASLLMSNVDDYDKFASWYADVNVLHPGSHLHFGPNGSLHESRYWYFPDVSPLNFDSDEEEIEAFNSVLSDAVSARLRSYGPPAMLLSGGIDSASVLTAARPLLRDARRDSIRTYSAISDDEGRCVESQAIRALIACGPCIPSTVGTPSFDGGLSVEELARLVWNEAHPIDNSLIMLMPLFARAAADGVTSLLNGAAGDVTTWVPTLFPALHMRRGEFVAAWRAAKLAAVNNTYLSHLSALNIYGRSAASLAPDWFKRYWGTARGFIRRDGLEKRAFNSFALNYHGLPPQRVRLGPHPPAQQMYDVALGASRSLDWIAHGQVGYDRVAGRFGLVSADVWSDRRLVAFYVALPLTIKAKGAWTKALVRSYLDSRTGIAVSRRTDKTHIGSTLTKRLITDTNAWQDVSNRMAKACAAEGHTAFVMEKLDLTPLLAPPPEADVAAVITSIYWRERSSQLVPGEL